MLNKEKIPERKQLKNFSAIWIILIVSLISLLYQHKQIKIWLPSIPTRQLVHSLGAYNDHPKSSAKVTSANTTNDLIGSGWCKIPNLDPFDRKFLAYYGRQYFTPKCPIAINFIQSNLNGSISFNRTAFKQHNIDYNKVKCYYQEIYRGRGVRNKVNSETPSLLSETLKPKSEVVRVWCKRTENDSTAFYDDILPVYRARNDLEKRKEDEKPNVLILNQDALSRLNAIRFLPKVFGYLKNHLKSHIFRVHVKCGFGSIENMMGVLTGKRMGSIVSKGRILSSELTLNQEKVPDHWPFIWKDFKKKGYATALAEDHTGIIVNAMNNADFGDTPTDHYLHTVVAAQIHYKSRISPPCLMNSPSYIATYRWVSNIMRLYRDVPVFVVQHEGTTHNEIGQFRIIDDPLLHTLKTLEKEKLLENTILIVSGDHGAYTAPFSATPIGRLEFRTPFLSITLPEKLRRKYPHLDKVLSYNEDQLTTMYDIHATLLDIVENKFDGSEDDAHTDRGRGLSLFKKIPKDRTCVDAGINLDNCPCLNMTDVSFEDEITKEWASAVVNYVNAYLKPYRKLCFVHTLKSIRMVKTYLLQVSAGVMMQGIQIMVETNPRGALYEGHLYYMDTTKKQFNISIIHRLDMYGIEKACISKFAHQYCHCRK